ncbi:MAG: tRNA (guanosine(37)-N1)-methyltransferase TrmD [Candidatus Omnitrophota bacterium]
MQIDIVTIFPKMFAPVLNESIIKRAQEKKKVKITIYDLRDFSQDKHRKVDDRPFGGGAGMVMNAAPFFAAVENILKGKKKTAGTRVVLLTPRGKRLNQSAARRLSHLRHLILLCGHYEGIDERVSKIVDEEISIGDYVLTGAELPAMVLVDAITRLIPGVLGHKDSANFESFEQGLLEYPQYTRPAEFRGMKAPAILLTGDHRKIAAWRQQQALIITRKKRPELLKNREE